MLCVHSCESRIYQRELLDQKGKMVANELIYMMNRCTVLFHNQSPTPLRLRTRLTLACTCKMWRHPNDTTANSSKPPNGRLPFLNAHLDSKEFSNEELRNGDASTEIFTQLQILL